MVRSSLLYYYSQRRLAGSFRGFFFIPTTLALFTSFFILFYIYSTSNLFSHHHHSNSHFISPSPFSTTPLFIPVFHNNASDSTNTKFRTFQLGHGLRPQSQRGLPLPLQFSSKGTRKFRSFTFYFLLMCFWVEFSTGLSRFLLSRPCFDKFLNKYYKLRSLIIS